MLGAEASIWGTDSAGMNDLDLIVSNRSSTKGLDSGSDQLESCRSANALRSSRKSRSSRVMN